MSTSLYEKSRVMLLTILFVLVLLNGCEDDFLKSDSNFECTMVLILSKTIKANCL